MSIHHQPIARRIDWVLDLAQRHTAAFRSPDAALERQRLENFVRLLISEPY